GLDVKHEDMRDVLWINVQDPIANVEDTVGDGYVNAKFGWNFIGNANGENVYDDALDVTHLIARYEPKYVPALPSTRLSEAERREFVAYQRMVSDYTTKMDEAQFGDLHFGRLKQSVDQIVAAIGKDIKAITKADLDKYETEDERQKQALSFA